MSIPVRPPFTTCEACGGEKRSYFNDTPFDVALTAQEAETRGVIEGQRVDIPTIYWMHIWGFVRIVDEPVEKWSYIGDGPEKPPKERKVRR